ncbi:uncharacterized protein TA08960 [Theileria annulata]|uniref:RRM domain-containing protein n=1 Tax=Theileria annulata TaxID=5874 RepID=Q4U9D3_THEAN|nr:uncharacterized protein TA08960 [Theileria annulata]CAI76570.1 hypothetical protein TA08960 [Theileria annulata]|eukprot:XP_953195.1 hypothetical protein TA08960 [Theileria annulata]
MMDIDKDENPSNKIENRLYKTAISGIMLNKDKYGNFHPLNLTSSKPKKLGLISRLIGKTRASTSKFGLPDRLVTTSNSLNRWRHDKFESLVSYTPGSMIYVRNLPQSVTSDELKIEKGGLVSAFVGFVGAESAQKAIESFHKSEMNGRTIKVSLSDTGIYLFNLIYELGKKQRNKSNSTGRVSIFDRMG